MIVVAGLSHKSAPIEVREQLAFRAEEIPILLRSLASLPQIAEVATLCTCNRVEIYAAARDSQDHDGSLTAECVEKALVDKAGPAFADEVRSHLYQYRGDAAIRHIFRVTSSLDSLVVGEPQILGQVKDALELATRTGTIGTLLGRALETALHTAKRVRSETQVGAGTVSVSSVAVDLARQIFGELEHRTVVLLGAGDMAEAAARSLCACGAKVHVVNRSLERAQSVATQFDGQARPWTELQPALIEADMVVASTASPHFVLTRELVNSVASKRRGRNLFIIDIAVPRDVDPKVNALDGIYLFDIDDLSNIAAQSLRERRQEAERAERIVDGEVDCFEYWVDSLQVAPTIVALRKQVQDVLAAELARSLDGRLKHLTAQDGKALEAMVNAAVNKLMHAPSTRLKAAATQGTAHELVDALRTLFELPVSEETSPAAQAERDHGHEMPPEGQVHATGHGEPSPTPVTSDAGPVSTPPNGGFAGSGHRVSSLEPSPTGRPS